VGRASRAWRGAALDRTQGPGDISLGACMTTDFVKRAAPGNYPARVQVYRHVTRINNLPRSAGQNVTCGNSREPPV
jgi:hypothetical protein